jgi:hypothetical protein
VLILDTGPIREIVSYYAVHNLRFHTLRPQLIHLVNPDTYENCSTFLSSFRKKTTSASVVAELYYWIRETEPMGHKQLWERVYQEFENMGMDENVVKLLDMQLELVTRYGPVDASLLEIARRNARQKPVILTLDSRLHAECVKAQISSQLLLEVCNPSR